MDRFEYKLVETPNKRAKYKGLPKAGNGFTQTVTDGMNELGRDGWEFMRSESISEKRGLLAIVAGNRHHEFMVYRRPLRGNGMSMDTPVKSRRVSREDVPNSEELRARITAIVHDGSSVEPANNPIGSPFEVIRSSLN